MTKVAAGYAIALRGGPGDGALFDAHELAAPPELIRVVHGGGDGVALLDLPTDIVAPDETEVVYRRIGRAFLCGRGRRHQALTWFYAYDGPATS